MPERLTILFAPLDAVGHVNACIGIAEVLRDRGHRIVFAISDNWRQKLKIYGFEEELIELSEKVTVEDPAKFWAELIQKAGMFGSSSPLEKIKRMTGDSFKEIIDRCKTSDPIMKEIVCRIKPDIILIDGFFWMPSLMNSGIPWVWSISCNPLVIDLAMDDKRLPPSTSGKRKFNEQKIQLCI
jgi:UDP:flavonoid glycosyltransferase YjiC (YdhE family)